METKEKQSVAPDATSNAGSNRSGGEGDEAAPVVALTCQKLAEAYKGKKIVRVSQKYIDIVLREKATGTGMYWKNRSMEITENYKGPLDLWASVAISNGIREKIHADDAAILEQYHRLSYAYAEVEEEPLIDNEQVLPA